MPIISRFYGIALSLSCEEHAVPHFQIRYGEDMALVSIEELEVLEGSIPPKALEMSREWAELHRSELRENWKRAIRREHLYAIDPLS